MAWDADVLVIGCGIAGGVAALRLADAGFRVLVLSRARPPREINTYCAQGGIVYRGPGDTPERLVEDILRAGSGRNRREAVEVLATEGPRWVDEVLIRRLKVPFDRQNSAFALAREGGHSLPRILHVADATGRAIELALLRELRRHPNMRLAARCTAVDLLVVQENGGQEGRCVGALVWDARTGRVRPVLAPRTILATGGFAAIFERTTNPPAARGDGIAMAYRAGARLADLEFVQFHPTAFAHPAAPPFLISEAVRGAGARLVHADGTPFMDRYAPEWRDLAPRDVVARAIYEEMQRRRVAHVYLDLRAYIPREEIPRRFPHLYRQCKAYGIDMTQDLVPVAPAAHYTCGGVWCDLWGRTTVPGLYAVGEVSCTGVHGANRLASTSLLEGLVWGARAATHIQQHWTPERPPQKLPPCEVSQSLSEPPPSDILLAWWQDVRRWMWQHVGVVRDATGLQQAIERLAARQQEVEALYRKYRPDDTLIGLRNAVQVALLVARAALENPTSCGCHYRADAEACHVG